MATIGKIWVSGTSDNKTSLQLGKLTGIGNFKQWRFIKFLSEN